MLESITKW